MHSGRFITELMALLNDSSDSKKFDTRMVERNVTRGVVTSEMVDDHVKNLPDDAENAEWVNIESLADDSAGESISNGKGSSH
jgi:hypothetical protein